MWIKSLDQDVVVNMIHITHFSIEKIVFPDDSEIHEVTAFLDTSGKFFSPSKFDDVQDQASLTVHQGTHEECVEFIDKQQFLEGVFQWIGYLVAGGIGSILTLIFQNVRS